MLKIYNDTLKTKREKQFFTFQNSKFVTHGWWQNSHLFFFAENSCSQGKDAWRPNETYDDLHGASQRSKLTRKTCRFLVILVGD
jgi:hypothetical protein